MKARLQRLFAWLGSAHAMRFVQAMMLVTLLVVAWLAMEKHESDECFERYVNAQAEASARSDDAMEKLIAESLNGGPAYVAAAREWLARYAEQKRARETSPAICE